MFQFYKDVPLLSSLSGNINREIIHQVRERKIDQISGLIVLNADIYNKLSCYLLCVTLLRWGDMRNLHLKSILQSKKIRIVQGKTKNFVSFPFEVLNDRLFDILYNLGNYVNYLNYNQTASYIQRFVRQHLNAENLDFNHKTHIFRHLYASYQKNQGQLVYLISKRLGHNNDNTVRSYIHNICFNHYHFII